MAIVINDFKFPYKRVEVQDVLQSATNSFGVFIDLDRANELAFKLSLEENAYLTVLKCDHGIDCNTTGKDEARKAFAKRFNIPDHLFNVNAARPWLPVKLGFDQKVVIPDLLSNDSVSDTAKEALRMYVKACKAGTALRGLSQYREAPICTNESFDNHRMTLVRTTWNILSTGRYSASSPSIQNMSGIMKGLITHPKGYEEIRCDSGQIEPRINFSWAIRDDLIMKLINLYDDAYYGMLHFCKMTDKEEAEARKNLDSIKPHEVTDDIKALRKNVKTLTNAGSYGSSDLGHVNKELADAFDRKLTKHPKRLANEQRVREDVKRGVDTFYTAFGNPIRPESNTKYTEGTEAWEGHLVRCGINNPIQGTASDLMCFSVMKAHELLAYFPNSHIGYYKHDEGMFYVHEDDMDKLKPELEEITAYNVIGWIPIRCETVIGRLPYDKQYPTCIC